MVRVKQCYRRAEYVRSHYKNKCGTIKLNTNTSDSSSSQGDSDSSFHSSSDSDSSVSSSQDLDSIISISPASSPPMMSFDEYIGRHVPRNVVSWNRAPIIKHDVIFIDLTDDNYSEDIVK